MGWDAAAWVEVCAGSLVVVALAWGGWWSWSFYDAQLRPLARTVPPVATPHMVSISDPAEKKRWQKIMGLLGEAGSDISAKHRDWARAALLEVLNLDPQNPDALDMLRQMELEPEPTLTPQEVAARAQMAHLVDLLGAAGAFLDAGRPDAAAPLIAEALQIDPQNQTAVALQERLETTAAGR